MNNINVIFWDFDGVILDSMSIRNKGFELIFADFDRKDVGKLLNFHKQNGGLSRYVKIKFFFEKILEKDITQDEINYYADRFSKIMLKELGNNELLIKDSVTFIKKNYKKFNFHIVSGSDQEELRILCDVLGIKKYFKTINGSPSAKKELIKNILDDYNYNADDCVLIGDSINDFDAARENKIRFIGYNNNELRDISWYYVDLFSSNKIF